MGFTFTVYIRIFLENMNKSIFYTIYFAFGDRND